MFTCTAQYLWQFTCILYDTMYTMHTVNTVREDEKRERRGRGGEGDWERERRKGYMYTQKIIQTSRH